MALGEFKQPQICDGEEERIGKEKIEATLAVCGYDEFMSYVGGLNGTKITCPFASLSHLSSM
jgi:hypothetical protein